MSQGPLSGVRVLDLSEIDLRPFRLGRDVSSISGEPGLAPPPRDRADAPGDIVGQSAPVPNNSRDLAIEITEVVKN